MELRAHDAEPVRSVPYQPFSSPAKLLFYNQFRLCSLLFKQSRKCVRLMSTSSEPATGGPPTGVATRRRIHYDRKERDPNMLSRKDTGLTKSRVAVLFGYVGTGYHGLQWDPTYPSM